MKWQKMLAKKATKVISLDVLVNVSRSEIKSIIKQTCGKTKGRRKGKDGGFTGKKMKVKKTGGRDCDRLK